MWRLKGASNCPVFLYVPTWWQGKTRIQADLDAFANLDENSTKLGLNFIV